MLWKQDTCMESPAVRLWWGRTILPPHKFVGAKAWRLPFSANSRHTQPQVATVKLHVFLHGKDIYKDILRYKCGLYAQRTSNFTAAAGEISLFRQMALFCSQCWGDEGTREGLQCLYYIGYGTTMWQNQTIDVPCIGGQLATYKVQGRHGVGNQVY